ncbi:MAG: tRNA (adenosine(37)-N6)-threonylcarbamoyltransferase complex ATPase subunit type 1 TsaE [Nitrospinota bacterium]
MRAWTFRSANAEETTDLGRAVGRNLKTGDVLCLTGTLGAGKTVLSRGIVEGVRGGDSKGVRSPSFTLVNEYGGTVCVYHVDLYRMSAVEEVSELGLDEILGPHAGREVGAVIVEWGEKLGHLAPADRLDVRLEMRGREARDILFEARGPRHAALLDEISAQLKGA